MKDLERGKEIARANAERVRIEEGGKAVVEARRVEEARRIQERIKVDNVRRAVVAASINKEVGEKAARWTDIDMAVQECCKETK